MCLGIRIDKKVKGKVLAVSLCSFSQCSILFNFSIF